MAETLLTLRDVRVRHGEFTTLEIESIELRSGEVLAIIGPNGAGKSTLLRVMGLLERPHTGVVLFQGENAFAVNTLSLRRRIATVFQEPLLLNVNVYENAAVGLKLRGFANSEIKRRIEPWLERLGIGHLRARSVRTLSGGEAQRTSLVRALVLEPEMLLLDEAFAGLDPTSREALLRDFQAIVQETNVATVLVTHDRHEAFALGQRVGVLRSGRLLQLSGRDEVFFRPASEAVAEIVGVENRLPGVVEKCDGEWCYVRVQQSQFKVRRHYAPGTPVVVCLRPEEVVVSRAGCPIGDVNRVQGRITGISPGMTHQRITLSCGSLQLVALVDRRSGGYTGFSKGDEITASFSFTAAHVIARN